MKKWPRFVLGMIAGVGVLAASCAAMADTWTLELKRLGSPGGVRIARAGQTLDDLCRYTSYQYFRMDTRQNQVRILMQPGGEAKAFSDIVEKEPEYVSEHPFRAVARLGSRQYAFVLDAKPAQSEEEAEKPESELEKPETKTPEPIRYERLYFDFNHNGDLTDDEVLETEPSQARVYTSPGYVGFSFPRVDLTLDVDGTEVEYAFNLSGYSRTSADYAYATARLQAAAYRHGEITLDGKTKRVALIDFNSNGRFDDEFTIRDDVSLPEGEIYPTYGDIMLVDPDPEQQGYRSPYDVTTADDLHQVAKLINIDGRYYDMEISPAGDKLTLTASSVPVGYVTNANDGFRAVLYGDQGFVKITGGKSEPVPLPEGEWKLLSYTIDRTGYEEEEAEAGEEEESEEAKQEQSLLKALADSLMGGSISGARPSTPRYTLVSARATRDYEAVRVGRGETVAMPFGPPYKPVVKVYSRGGDQADLALSLVGSGGERCSNMMVDGGRPEEPAFTIKTPDGEEVVQGKFQYG